MCFQILLKILAGFRLYELLKENGECKNSGKRINLLAANEKVGLKECCALADRSNDCAENLVEWGNSATFDPDSKGHCKCYAEGIKI